MAKKGAEENVSRIYQGRVTKCTLDGREVELSYLMKHHEFFQDAVNYYMLALCAMASDPESDIGKFRTRMQAPPNEGGAWDDFWRNGEKRPGMKHSIMRTLGISGRDLPFEEACSLLLEKNEASKEVLQAAADLISKNCAKDVQKPGRSFSPMLCDSKCKANFLYDKFALAGIAGHTKLSKALYSAAPVDEVKKLIPDLSMNWVHIMVQQGHFFTDAEAKKKLKTAIDFFMTNEQNKVVRDYLDAAGTDAKKSLTSFSALLDKMEHIKFERNNRTHTDIRNAYLLLKFFPGEFTVGLIKCFIKEEKKAPLAVNPYNLSDDPIKLARGSRKCVFRYFTDRTMPCVWKKLDIEAFTEALKTFKQFADKSAERKNKRDALEKQFAFMNGERRTAVADNEEDTGENVLPLPVLEGDPRWDSLKEILQSLGVSNSFTEDEITEYGLSQRTLRNFHELQPRWQKILNREKDGAENAILKELNKFQGNTQNQMGSADLYHKLAEKRYWDLWRDDYPAGKKQSHNILSDAVRYYEIRDEIERLKEPINFTPADPLHSRRLNNLKVLCQGKKQGHGKEMTFTTRIAVPEQNKRFVQKDCVITYSAPRLTRDGLSGTDSAKYLSPALRALMPNFKNPVNFSKCAVFLMPDIDSNGNPRYLLNFPLSLPVSKIHKAFPSFFPEHEFYFANSVLQMLLWPGIKNGKNQPSWHLQRKAFSFVSVDLGQRSAGALCRIRVTPDSNQNTYAVFLGND